MIYTLTVNPSLDKLFILDTLRVGNYNRGEVARYDLGGKGINVSRCLQSLGVKSVVVGYFAGSTGGYLLDAINCMGIQVEPIMIDGESRSNITLHESAVDRMTKLNEFGPIVDEDAYQMMIHKIAKMTRPGDIWVLSGSLSPGLPDDAYAVFIKTIRDCGGLTFLDTSGKWLEKGLEAVPDFLHINIEETEFIVQKKIKTREDLQTAIQKIQEKGIAKAVISMGAEGALFLDGEGARVVHAPSVKVRTTVGAGDAMMAMIVYGYLHHWSLKEISAWSVAAGSASVAQEGTSSVTMDQVASLMSSVITEEYDR